MPSFKPSLYAPHLPPVVAWMNRAGSVGKTTVAYNGGVQLTRRDRRVLVIDADLQSDASYWSGWDGDLVPDGALTVHDVMLGRATLADATVPGRTRIAAGDSDEAFEVIDGLDLVRGDNAMSQADSELAQDPAGVFWLQRALKREISEGQYDLIFIDCPASLGRLSISLLLAATDVVVCMKPTRKEMRGAIALTNEIDKTRDAYEDFGVNTSVAAYLMNESKKSDSQGKFYKQIQDEATELFGDRLLPLVHSSVYVPEAYDAQEPLVVWAKQSPIVSTVDSVLDDLGYKAAAVH
jgi:cellulose biosynthesis protein BcsQ